MALLNPTFVDAGPRAGQAEHWTITATTSLERLAAFGGVAREDFERWVTLLADLSDVTVVRAFFGRDGFEAFERALLRELPTGRVVSCTFSRTDIETWTDAPLLRDWAAVPSAPGLTEAFERADFVADWFALASTALPTETFAGAWTQASTL